MYFYYDRPYQFAILAISYCSKDMAYKRLLNGGNKFIKAFR